MSSLYSEVQRVDCDLSLLETINRTATFSIVVSLFFVILVLTDVLKEVNHNIYYHLNTALYFQKVFLELTEYYIIINNTREKIVTKQFPTSSEFKASKSLTTFNNSNCRISASDA